MFARPPTMVIFGHVIDTHETQVYRKQLFLSSLLSGGGRLRSLKIPNTEIAVCPISLRMSSRCSTTSGRLKISEVFSDGYEVLGSFLVAPFPYFDPNLVQIPPSQISVSMSVLCHLLQGFL